VEQKCSRPGLLYRHRRGESRTEPSPAARNLGKRRELSVPLHAWDAPSLRQLQCPASTIPAETYPSWHHRPLTASSMTFHRLYARSLRDALQK